MSQLVGRIQLNKQLAHEDYASMPVGEALQEICDWNFQLLLAKRKLETQAAVQRLEAEHRQALSLQQLLTATARTAQAK